MDEPYSGAHSEHCDSLCTIQNMVLHESSCRTDCKDVRLTCDKAMMTEAPVMKPQMTEWERKLVIQPSLNRPTAVYRLPASSATCNMQAAHQTAFVRNK